MQDGILVGDLDPLDEAGAAGRRQAPSTLLFRLQRHRRSEDVTVGQSSSGSSAGLGESMRSRCNGSSELKDDDDDDDDDDDVWVKCRILWGR